MDELAQQQLQASSSRVAEANIALSAAHTAATRAVDAGAPDFRERIRTLIEGVDTLFADMETAAGPTISHRGLRIPTTCDDESCPIHGEGATSRTLHGRAGYE